MVIAFAPRTTAGFESSVSPPNMKICSRCNIEKELTEFHKRKTAKDGLMSCCKACAHKGTMASRRKKPDHYRKVSKELGDSYLEKFQEWKVQQKCCKCGEAETCCLDLHHLDPTQKDVAVATVTRSWTWNKLQTEIQKCIVVCRNCHAKIHAGLLGP